MSNVVTILESIDGRTVYLARGHVMVRFDSEEDRVPFEAACPLLECIQREDVKAAAEVVFDAVNEGLVVDENELLDYIDDDDVREIIRLELDAHIAGQADD
jgi:hypothetical protein